MTQDTRRDGPPPIPVRHQLGPRELGRRKPVPVDFAPVASDRAALAEFLGILSLSQLRLKGELTPFGDEGWQLDARLTAALEQACVVTLSPVAETVDETVRRVFVPEGEALPAGTVDLDPEAEEDDPEPFNGRIDLAAVAVETLALAMTAYPRAPDAELDPETAGRVDAATAVDERLKPFAGLADLKRRLEQGRG